MTINNRLKRLARRFHLLQLAAWGYELYRLIRRPHTHGALVAIWHNNQVLMVKTSYRKGYGLPGGGLQPGESGREAAVREVNEELGLAIESSWLQDPWTITEQQRGGRNTVTIFALPWTQVACAPESRSTRPAFTIDQLEIISTAWMSRDEALQQHLPGHLHHNRDQAKIEQIARLSKQPQPNSIQTRLSPEIGNQLTAPEITEQNARGPSLGGLFSH